jgi:hypothetical protein
VLDTSGEIWINLTDAVSEDGSTGSTRTALTVTTGRKADAFR